MGIEELKMALSWEVDNFSQRNDEIKSDPFSSGGCKWCVLVHPKGYRVRDHLSLSIRCVFQKSARPGWKRKAIFGFVLLNQSGKELYRSPDECRLFCAEASGWGFIRTLPLTKLQEKGFLEKDKLTIQLYINVLEVVHQGKPTANDFLDFNGFQILASQTTLVGKIYAEHPDFALDFRPKNQGVKMAYMNLLIGLVETLRKSPKNLSGTELVNAQCELTELTEAGFRLDWLKSNLEQVSLEREKLISDGSWVQQLEERVKNVELALSDLKADKIKSAPDSPFEFMDLFIKRFFLSCFSISNSKY